MRPHIGFNAEILFITSCTDTTVIIHGKFNNASVTTCKNLAIIVENVIASVEIIKSNDVKLQVLHKCKQAIVDRSVKTGVYLNDESKDIKVNTTGCSSTFIYFPTTEADEHGNLEASLGIPETYTSKIINGKLVTVPLDLTAE